MPKLVAASLSHDEFHKLKQQASKTTKDVESEVEKVEHFQTPSYGVPWFDDKLDKYANNVVKRPWCMLCGCYGIIMVCIVLGVFASGVIMVPNGFYEWYVKSSDAAQHADMITSARQNDLLTNTSERSTASFYQLMMYESLDSTNIFTPANIQAMCQFESSFTNFKMAAKDSESIATTAPPDWLESDYCPAELNFKDYCLLDQATGNCSTPDSGAIWSGSLSIVNLVYTLAKSVGTSTQDLVKANGDWDCSLLEESDVELVSDYLIDQMSSTDGQVAFGFFMKSDTNDVGFSTITRSGIAVAGPLCLPKDGVSGAGECFDFASDSNDLFSLQALSYQNNLIGPWMLDSVAENFGLEDKFLHPMFYDSMEAANVEFFTFSLLLQNWETLRLLEMDQIIVIFSLGFVYIWLFVHLQSFFLASVAVSQIFLSIPASIFPYAFVLQVKYFGLMQYLTVFIILGVGADDVFVLADAWHQASKYVPVQSVEGAPNQDATDIMRLKYALVRTTYAVFNTSFTTSMAFFATAISPIMPISTFGVFSAVVILMNYVFVLTLTPAAIMVNELGKRRGCTPCSCCCYQGFCLKWFCAKNKYTSDLVISDETPAKESEMAATDTPASSGSESEAGNEKKRIWDELLPAYKRVIQHKPTSYFLIFIFTCWTVASIYLAAQLQPPVDTEKWLPANHMLERAFDLNSEFYSLGEEQYAKYQLVWGMKSLDESDYNQYDPPCSCTEANGCTGWKMSPENCRGTVVYDEDFDLFASATQDVLKTACSTLPAWPCDEDRCDFGLLIRPNSTICFLTAFESWALSSESVDAAAMVGTESNRETYMKLLYKFRNTQYPQGDSSKSYNEIIGFTDKRSVAEGPSYVQVQGTMTMPLLTPLSMKGGIEAQAEALLDSLDRPPTAKHVFQYTFDWVWTVTQQGTVDGLTSGMAIAFPIAFLALIAATANWILALYSIIAVGAIVSSVLATCQLQGWALGTGEAIAGVMVIGLSVDYTIHLAHMYDHAGHEQGFTKRMARFEYAIDTMAGTVLAGAITTCGAGLFMFLCVQTFFTKMATLIVLTIFMSALYALLWFMPLMAHFGPEDRQGFIDFSAIKKKLLCQS